MNSQRGSAIIMLFIAVALFGMLAFAFLQGSRTNLDMMTDEAQNAQATQAQDCTNVVDMAEKRLSARGCTTAMISHNMDGTNDNPSAPANGSCSIYHTNGGGVKPCGGLGNACSLAQRVALSIGGSCGGIIYAGDSPDGSKRMYTTPADYPPSWPDTSWNAGNASGQTTTGLTSSSTGKANSAALATSDADSITGGLQPHNSAAVCENLVAAGYSDWYLPASGEVLVLYTNRVAIGNFVGAFYQTSTEINATQARRIEFSNGGNNAAYSKDSYGDVRCVRTD